jgi:ferredoxin
MGRIDAIRLPLLAPDFRERTVFCCGPDPFMRAVRGMLDAAGFDMTKYHQESFAAPIVEGSGAVHAPAENGAAEVSKQRHSIRFTLAEVDAECVAGQTVLQTARSSGVRIPPPASSALCGTCKVMKVSGDVEMSHNGGILDHEIDDGFYPRLLFAPDA